MIKHIYYCKYDLKVIEKFARLNKKKVDEALYIKATVHTEKEKNNNDVKVFTVKISFKRNIKLIYSFIFLQETDNCDKIAFKSKPVYTTLDLFKTKNMRNMTLNVLFQW